jgi:hypothetical protein
MLDVHTREQLLAGGVIELTGHREAVAGLVSLHGGPRLHRIEAIDGARIIPEVPQVHFCEA